MIDCTRKHFGGDILRAKSLFSVRWKEDGLEPSSMELHEQFIAKRLALSVDVAGTPGPLNRYGWLHPQKSWDPISWDATEHRVVSA